MLCLNKAFILREKIREIILSKKNFSFKKIYKSKFIKVQFFACVYVCVCDKCNEHNHHDHKRRNLILIFLFQFNFAFAWFVF
jgi:hypothetical protein